MLKSSRELGSRCVRFHASLNALEGLRRLVQGVFAARQIDPQVASRVVLAAHETAANIIRHGLQERSDSSFLIEVRVVADGILLRFTYSGQAFDPTDAPPPSFDGSKEGGLGLFLIGLCVDSVTYDQDEAGKNRITLIRSLHPPETPGAERQP